MKKMDLIRDLPKGPLEVYRKRATFNWKSMRINLLGEDLVRYQKKLWNYIESSPEFQRPVKTISLDETRRRCYKQLNSLIKNDILPIDHPGWFNYLFFYDASLPVVTGITQGMVPSVIFSLGTNRHGEILEKIQEGKYTSCFALTEIAHGTNIRGMLTTAKYDPRTESFIFHSPNFESAKCWAGALGKAATHAIVYAQLITPDNENHGLHPFIVQIRDPKTFLPMPGITVGDMGEKVALNGVDNGFLMFNHYSVPRINLLNKNADVTKEGKYVAQIKDRSKLFGASLGALSTGRVTITMIGTMYITLATVIAIRYVAARKQFGPSAKEEYPVIEYQVQQGRLFPHLASMYAMTVFSHMFVRKSREFQIDMLTSDDKELISTKGLEIHALSSAAKPLCTWTARDAIQDCREACGGHGYLKVSRLGDIRSENDANCTYEGENNVLIQQASNWLLSQWANVSQGKKVASPLGSASFLEGANQILSLKFNCSSIDQTMQLENLLIAFKWLTCYYLKKTYERVHRLKQNGNGNFEARNDSQTYFARTLTLVYAEHAIIQTFCHRIQDPEFKDDERLVLTKLCSLYAGWSLERRLGDLYAGGYASPDSKIDILLREGIIAISKDLVKDAVALVDVVAPPDFILNSPLGMSDGEIYKHLEKSFLKNPENLQRPSWWQEISRSKL
ncbi:peroxisomal acyl-coenzyme A oxidase 3-like isoform X2 [Belonocnema kinseyi]|nr:peroxisomal acyl-coenzyme A oxidase 3-like isoform X2 [Belonocnema kinseyi]XP_033230397.1 peroxisomal acyl-coenzyme A oxidase 3-like isoform X2 [Belonocnema kinseyi]